MDLVANRTYGDILETSGGMYATEPRQTGLLAQHPGLCLTQWNGLLRSAVHDVSQGHYVASVRTVIGEGRQPERITGIELARP